MIVSHKSGYFPTLVADVYKEFFMKRMIRNITLCFALCITAIACCPTDEPQPEPPRSTRTVLVYMLADNNLGTYYHYDQANIKEMMNAVAGDEINGRLLIYYSTEGEAPSLQEIRHTGNGNAALETLKVYDSTMVSTSVATMQEVMRDMQSICQTDSYGLIMWSHATGWLPQNKLYRAPTSFGREGDNDRSIDIDSLGMALAPFHFDFILFDACLMSSIEVAYELRHSCDYIIASPTETLGAGYPYYRMTPLLFEETVDYEKICRCYYDKFIAPNTDEAGTIALIKTEPLDSLADCCRDIVQRHSAQIASLNLRDMQHYDRTGTHVFYDFDDYIGRLAEAEEYAAFDALLQKAILYKAASPTFISIPIRHFCGISCYIPGSSRDTEIETYYTKLKWYNAVY